MARIEEVKKGEELLAIIIRSTKSEKALEFPTPDDFPMQLGIHNRPKGEYIKAHAHAPFKNLDIPVQEIFFIEKGKMLVTLYSGKEKYKDVMVSDGEIILLNCGHSMKFLEDTRAVEVKQGPYRQKEYEKISLE